MPNPATCAEVFSPLSNSPLLVLTSPDVGIMEAASPPSQNLSQKRSQS